MRKQNAGSPSSLLRPVGLTRRQWLGGAGAAALWLAGCESDSESSSENLPPPVSEKIIVPDDQHYIVVTPGAKVSTRESYWKPPGKSEWYLIDVSKVPTPNNGLGGGARAATFSGNGGSADSALFAGGVGQSPATATSQAYVFNLSELNVTGLSMGTARMLHSVTTLADNRVLVVGGWDGNGAFAGMSSTEIFDPATLGFSPAGALPAGRAGHAAARLADGRVLVCGGTSGVGELRSANLYDPATDSFGATGNMQLTRPAPAAVTLGDGRVLVVGSNGSALAEAYDPASGGFAAVGTMTAVHGFGLSATLLPNGLVLIVGGLSGPNGGSSAVAEVFDPGAGTFTAVGRLNTPRSEHVAILQNDGKVLVCGGISDTGATLASCELFDPATNAFSAAADMPRAGSDQAGVLLSKA